jgi:hypothetical protein
MRRATVTVELEPALTSEMQKTTEDPQVRRALTEILSEEIEWFQEACHWPAATWD